MNKLVKIGVLMFVILLVAAPAFAQDGTPSATPVGKGSFSIYLGGAFGAGLVILGAGAGIGKIGSSAVESMSRPAGSGGQHPDGHDHLGRSDRRRHVLRAHRLYVVQ